MNRKRIFRILNTVIGILLAAGFLAVLLPIFVCDQFRINGESMQPTLVMGDHVVVNKLLMGARVYMKYDFDDPDMESFRMPGIRRLRPGDVAVFNYPKGRGRGKIEFRINYVYAKRCIGSPGDTVSIVDGYYRNSRYGDTAFGVEEKQQELREMPDSVLSRMKGILKAFPFSPDYGWTIKDFGPMYIPEKGGRTRIDTSSVKLYRRIIEYETGILPEIRKGKVCLDGNELDEYVFRGNWYFFGGDNVLNSKDSRYIGLIPEEYIVGIATRILFHEDTGGNGVVGRNRFMKRI